VRCKIKNKKNIIICIEKKREMIHDIDLKMEDGGGGIILIR
jgi:hypothetical protein